MHFSNSHRHGGPLGLELLALGVAQPLQLVRKLGLRVGHCGEGQGFSKLG